MGYTNEIPFHNFIHLGASELAKFFPLSIV